jgi:cation diffusion facilitator CzcD-associated flavoprotein CzcO
MAIGAFSCQVAVIGAGPYGLAVTSHLRSAGLETLSLGRVMEFWDQHMPRGMLLRSPHNGSDIADAEASFSVYRYEQAREATLGKRIPLEDFVRYGRWFQEQSVPDLDSRMVEQIERVDDGFRLTMEDGDRLIAPRVIVAAGIGAFAHVPQAFTTLPRELVSHASDRANRDLSRFASQRIIVIGAGQSATESAVLLSELGADVEMLVRQPRLRWLKSGSLIRLLESKVNPLQAPGKIGPAGVDWLIEHPHLFNCFPRRMRSWMSNRAIRPAASAWLRPRSEKLTISASRHVVAAEERGEQVHLRLSDGSDRLADHVLLATGYRIDLARYRFLGPDLLSAIQTVNGYPVLDAGFQSSLAGLHFVGAPAAYSFGPLCRFVIGTRFTARTITKSVRKWPARKVLAPV